MNTTLFKATLKSNWLIGVIIFAVMFMYITMIISMFDPEGLEDINAMMEVMPKEMISAMGMEDLGTNLTEFLASYYYGFIAIMFPMIYSIIVANRLVAKHVDTGSMAYLLSTPNSRTKIVTTQAAYLIISTTVLYILVTAAGILFSELMFAGELEIGRFIVMNIVTLIIFYAITGISFFFSCLFDDSRYSLAFGAGIPILFFVINMLSNVGDQYEWLEYLTIFSFMEPMKLAAGETIGAGPVIIPVLIALVAYGSGIYIFDRRNLPL